MIAPISNELFVERLLKEIPELIAVYRFGSWGTPRQRQESDIDLAFLAEGKLPNRKRWRLAQDIATAVGKDVDLVDMRNASTVMRARIITTGERVYCCQNTTRCYEYEAMILAQYARLNEERRDIISDIEERGSVYGR